MEAQAPLAVRLPQSITTVSRLRSDEAVVLRPEMAGRIAQIAFKEGQRVTRGDVLVRLDDSVQKADLERARANLTLSKSKYERAVDLRAKGFISSQAAGEAENTFKVAQTDAALAEARIAKIEIRAPFGGIIGLRSVSVGDYVKEGQDMVNLEEIDPLNVDFRVPEVFLSQLRSGQALQITMDALPDRTGPGQVFAINPLNDANGRAIAIRAQVPNADGKLRPGMFARVQLLTSEIRDSLTIPEESIFPVGDDKYVFKVDDWHAQRNKVDIGQRRETKPSAVCNAIEGFFHRLTAGYRRALGWALHHRIWIVAAALVVAATSVVLFKTLRSELAPTEDRGVVFSFISAQEGSTARYTAENLKPVEFVVMSSAPYEDLARLVERFIAEASKNPGLMNLDSDRRLDKPELKVSVNRDKIVDVGASVDAVDRTLETMLAGRQVTRFKRDGEQYDVVVQVADADRRSPGDISDIYVRGKSNEMIQLSNLVTVRESVAPKSLNHFNRIRSVTITATLAPGYTLGQALLSMQETARKVLPPTAQTDLNGQSREFRDSSTDIYFVFVLALAFIYLVLSAQFESFIDPFVIMLTVPLSMTGALLALKLTGGALNVYSQIGLITLVGLITKHGILIVEFSNQMQAQGKGVLEAVEEAAVPRLRPILMTTGAMVLGAVPLALSSGAGSESRQQIGRVIVGGLLLGTFRTLFVVPTAYTLLARRHRTFEERLEAERAQNARDAHQPATAD